MWLALAGANLPAKNILEGRKGVLTGESLAALDMRGLEMVVLSACQSGQGVERNGEGVYGLQRAFHIGGAQNVIASLWDVNDHATSALMRRFYQNLWGDSKMSPLDALREAQLAMLREYDSEAGELRHEAAKRDPTPAYFWAAFMLSGGGR